MESFKNTLENNYKNLRDYVVVFLAACAVSQSAYAQENTDTQKEKITHTVSFAPDGYMSRKINLESKEIKNIEDSLISFFSRNPLVKSIPVDEHNFIRPLVLQYGSTHIDGVECVTKLGTGQEVVLRDGVKNYFSGQTIHATTYETEQVTHDGVFDQYVVTDNTARNEIYRTTFEQSMITPDTTKQESFAQKDMLATVVANKEYGKEPTVENIKKIYALSNEKFIDLLKRAKTITEDEVFISRIEKIKEERALKESGNHPEDLNYQAYKTLTDKSN